MSEIEQKYGFLRGYTGEKSSKRLWGMILMISAIVMGFGIFGTAVIGVSKDSNVSLEVLKLFLGTGCILLGIGLAERFGNK